MNCAELTTKVIVTSLELGPHLSQARLSLQVTRTWLCFTVANFHTNICNSAGVKPWGSDFFTIPYCLFTSGIEIPDHLAVPSVIGW